MSLSNRTNVELPKDPVLVVALEGWIDAGFAAQRAAEILETTIASKTLATFSIDELIDQRARRPRVRITDGVSAPLVFSEPRLLCGVDSLGASIALLIGPEPDYRWSAFSDEVAMLASAMGARLVVGLGAFPAPVPHTRPVRLAAVSGDENLVRNIGFVPGAIEAPAGIVDLVAERCTAAGIASVVLWARVPHYVVAMPFPSATAALLDGLAGISGLHLETDSIAQDATRSLRRIDELISQSTEHKEMVNRLELKHDSAEGTPVLSEQDLPSGDELAAELERFLRDETL